MPFPLDYHGEVRWRGKTSLHGEHGQHEVLHALVTALTGGKGTAHRDGATVSFTGGLGRFSSNVNILVPISYGYLEVKSIDDAHVVVSYYLNFQQLLVLVSVFALFVLSLLVNAAEPLAARLGFPALLWVWAFGLNYAITIFRFPAFIKRALERM